MGRLSQFLEKQIRLEENKKTKVSTVTFTGGSDVTGFDAVRVGRGMPRAPVPFCGCGGTPHGRGSFCGAYGVRGSAVRARKRGIKTNRCRNKRGLYSDYVQKGRRYLVAPEPFGGGVRDLEECSGRVSEESVARTYGCSGRTWTRLALLSFRSDLDAAGSSCSGRRERRVKGDGMAGVPSQWEGTGQEDGESGKAGVPSQWEGTGQESGESGKAGVPSQWEGTGQESGESGLLVESEAESESARRGPFIATVGLRAARGSRLGRWGSSAQRGVRVLSAGRNTGSGADSVDAAHAVGSALIFCTGSAKERNFSATGSVSK
ncbi:hypothetical protein GEV33_010125 [Tenebrio molitor]|uniref:Uncharacterized protein n=1 Tax=Tenebrio molitor TaxID=7067 RepID=A0A8J6HEF4_TENMO|nr:hypothetical protein GEV33_010125 [Tenebrio molitor]